MIIFNQMNINCEIPLIYSSYLNFPQSFPKKSYSWVFCFPNLGSNQDLYIAFAYSSLILNVEQFLALKKYSTLMTFPPRSLNNVPHSGFLYLFLHYQIQIHQVWQTKNKKKPKKLMLLSKQYLKSNLEFDIMTSPQSWCINTLNCWFKNYSV